MDIKRDINTIIDLNAKTLNYKELHEIIKKTSFTYQNTSETFTVIGIPIVVNIIDSITDEKVVTDIIIKNNSVTIKTNKQPKNNLNITIISTLI